jgi:probable phosphoglycerate mutase
VAPALLQEGFDLVITSDLLRARHSGELLANAWGWPVEMVVEPLLRERDIGAWSAMTASEIRESWPEEFAAFTSDEGNTSPGGEPLDGFDKRAADALRRVDDLIARSSRNRALVVTHGGVIRSLIRQADMVSRPVGNLSGGWVETDSRHFRMVHWVDLLRAAAASSSPKRMDRSTKPAASAVTPHTDPGSHRACL